MKTITIDRDLVESARDSADALEEVIATVRPAVLRHARARLWSYQGGVETAEDVTQEVCLAVALAVPGWRDEGTPFGAFVHRVTVNKIADAQRGYGRGPRQTDEVLDQVEPGLGPEQQAVLLVDADDAHALLAKLSEHKARVVWLWAEGFSAIEVGELLGMTANAVRVAQHRAFKELRAL